MNLLARPPARLPAQLSIVVARPRPRPRPRLAPAAGAGETSRILLEFAILTVGLYSFQQWVFYRTLRKREEEENKND